MRAFPPVKLTALLVDDEEPARRELRFLLEETEQVEVVGEAASGEAAVELTEQLRPDALFLDVQMPGLDGFAVAERVLAEVVPPPLFIFATAYDAYALKAFEVNAVDYLLKPFRADRVAQAVERLQERRGQAENQALASSLKQLVEQVRREREPLRVPVEKNGRIVLLPVREIVFAACREGEVFLKTLADEYPVRTTLGELEERLGRHFLRVHKGYVVNLDRIAELIPWFHGTYLLVMGDRERTEIPVSRRLAQTLREKLGLAL
ncbi:MAG TPA: response regulator transcription factor [Firmicutes bacterium]|nr:response regulator transcription factor [Bacillota bacterium]